MTEMTVTLSPSEAADTVENYIRQSAVSTELVDRYDAASNDGRQICVLVFEKYFMRNSSRASLTVTLENLNGAAHVRAVGSGGGQGTFFHFDWGAGGSFESDVEEALRDFIS